MSANKTIFSFLLRTALGLSLAIALSGCVTMSGIDDRESGELAPDFLELPSSTTVIGINTAPAAWRSMTSVPNTKISEIRDVEGKACQFGVSIPAGSPSQGVGYSTKNGLIVNPGWAGFKGGDGGFADAVKFIARENDGPVALTDVKVDTSLFSILVFRRQCVRVNAKALIFAF